MNTPLWLGLGLDKQGGNLIIAAWSGRSLQDAEKLAKARVAKNVSIKAFSFTQNAAILHAQIVCWLKQKGLSDDDSTQLTKDLAKHIAENIFGQRWK